jgi:hypothetical protein
MWTPVGWETLLNFDGEPADVEQYAPSPAGPSNLAYDRHGRQQSQPIGNRAMAGRSQKSGASGGASVAGPTSFAQGRAMANGNGLAWKTILASQVDVDGVGQIGVARVLQEVWTRGGGEQVRLDVIHTGIGLIRRCRVKVYG